MRRPGDCEAMAGARRGRGSWRGGPAGRLARGRGGAGPAGPIPQSGGAGLPARLIKGARPWPRMPSSLLLCSWW